VRIKTRTLTPADPAWPSSLNDLADPPVQIRVRGSLPELRNAVAVVGTRYADEDALAFAHRLGHDLALAGCAVVSGGALGIDGAAHRGALDAGGPTVCVLASGFAPAYPREHAALFEQIAQSGALVSEAPDRAPPEGWTFLRRNRLIAALAPSLVVVQAPERSGALSSARVALKLERQVFSVPYGPWDVRGGGCLQLLRNGARICTSVRDVLSVPARETGAVARKSKGTPSEQAARAEQLPLENTLDVSQLDEEGRAVLRALGRRPVHADNLARALGVPIMRVQHVLLELLVAGLVREPTPGRYALHTVKNPELRPR
jgi:DNA processing protein